MYLNQNYSQLQDSYLFSEIAGRVKAYTSQHPQTEIYRLGIGDVTLPLVPKVVQAMEQAVKEMGVRDTFRGYGEEQGYEFLRQAVCDYYRGKQVDLDKTEVFISDGAKSDLGNILDIFSAENKVLIPNPVYPVYVDTNLMAGRKISYIQGNPENNFLPLPNQAIEADIIYLCSPNNPTGAAYTKEQLQLWVDYALGQEAIILFDSAYESFVQDNTLPTSIYQIPGARACAIEFCSFSKTAGFTGTRCGYTVIPYDLIRENTSLHKLWLRRQTTKFNGVPYIIQRGAEAAFSPEGLAQIKGNIACYMENARIIAQTLKQLDIWFVGGSNAPYIWLKCPDHMTSWDFFDRLLTQAHVVGTPGVGFGSMGEGFFRLSAFGDREKIEMAMTKVKPCLK